MEITRDIAALRARVSEHRRQGRPVAFVPTMGNLHEGHLSLVREARANAPIVVASIFVNRLQFGPNEDFGRYPRTFEADCQKLEGAGVDCVFVPDEKELYPEPQEYMVEVPELGRVLEGEFRPGFFRGVATVVLKLFNVVQPDIAAFGKKDYQQLVIVRGMVRQLALPIRIVACKTVRAPDGVALSSRNGYLNAEQRARAPLLHQVLTGLAAELRSGGREAGPLESAALARLNESGWKADYVAVRNRPDLKLPARIEGQLVVLAAAWLGTTRLIDNLEVDV